MGECLPEFRSLPWKDESQDKAEAMSWQATCSTWYTSSPPSHPAQCGFSLRPSLVDYHFGDMKERCNDAWGSWDTVWKDANGLSAVSAHFT